MRGEGSIATIALPFRPGDRTLRRLLILAALAALLAVAVTASLAVGARPLPPAEVWRVLLAPDDSRSAIIVWQLRMPRTGLGLAVGVGFALAGALMQGATRNPLADPGLLGVNAGAALAVVLVTAFAGGAGLGATFAAAFAGAVAAALVVHGLGAGGARPDRVRLLLAGAAISASLGAMTGLVTMTHTAAFESFRFWIVGALAGRPPGTLAMAAPFLLAGTVLALALGPALNALAMGEEVAVGLGLRLGLVRAGIAAAITLLAGASVAAAGPIGFAGLVTPHAARLVMGEDWRWILAACLVAGPLLMLSADIAGRVVAAPAEIEAGVVLAFIGAPVLLHLVLATGRRRGR